MKSFFARNRLNLALAGCSVLVALLCAEVAFRVHLHLLTSRADHDHLNFDVVNRSYWEFDEQLGFHYKPNASADWCSILDGKPYLAGTVSFDRRGNSGPDVDDAGSEIRIAVAGDSFSVIQHDGLTWLSVLEEQLRQRTGRKVAVLNYAKDGYGILQMFDQAGLLVEERPDVILIAFITPDLVRERFWRMELETPDGPQLFTSTTPVLQLDKPGTYARTTLVEPLATRQWAERLIASQDRHDPVLRSLADTYLRGKKNASITRFNPFSLRTLYLWERVTNPRVQAGGIVNSEIGYTDFSRDRRFMEAVAKLKRSQIPVYLVLLPFHPDLQFGEFVLDDRFSKLLGSLRSATGFPLLRILPPVPMGAHADIMVLSPQNLHPSRYGLNFYGVQVGLALVRESVIGDRRGAAGRGRD